MIWSIGVMGAGVQIRFRFKGYRPGNVSVLTFAV